MVVPKNLRLHVALGSLSEPMLDPTVRAQGELLRGAASLAGGVLRASTTVRVLDDIPGTIFMRILSAALEGGVTRSKDVALRCRQAGLSVRAAGVAGMATGRVHADPLMRSVIMDVLAVQAASRLTWAQQQIEDLRD